MHSSVVWVAVRFKCSAVALKLEEPATLAVVYVQLYTTSARRPVQSVCGMSVYSICVAHNHKARGHMCEACDASSNEGQVACCRTQSQSAEPSTYGAHATRSITCNAASSTLPVRHSHSQRGTPSEEGECTRVQACGVSCGLLRQYCVTLTIITCSVLQMSARWCCFLATITWPLCLLCPMLGLCA